METTIGQRWEVYDFARVSDRVPQNGEVVCIRHADWPNHIISLTGNSLSTVGVLYGKWLEMLDPELESRLIDRINEEAGERERGDGETLQSARGYTDERVNTEAENRRQGDINTLADANRHANERVDAEAEARRQGDVDTLASANRHGRRVSVTFFLIVYRESHIVFSQT